jgi:crossover junction endodeoxyribonuclease RusA
MTTVRIDLPWSSPPLSLNDRGWTKGASMAKAATTARVFNDVMWLARSRKLPVWPAVQYVTVQLHYRPRNAIRRDTDNLVATLKPICDAIAGGSHKRPGYGMVPDDIPKFMGKPEPIIHDAIKGQPGCMWLEISYDTTEPETA